MKTLKSIVYTVIIIALIGFFQTTKAQSVEQDMSRRFIADTVDVSSLRNVHIVESLEDFTRIEVKVTASGVDAATVQKLTVKGFFNMQVADVENNKVVITDHNDKSIFFNGHQMEDHREYTVFVPKHKTVVNKKPTE